MRASSAFGTAEDFAHCGSAKCSAMIQGLNQQLGDALLELAQLHKTMAETNKEQDVLAQQYRHQIDSLCAESALRRDTFEKGSGVISEHDTAIQQAHAQVHDMLGRLARREQDEQARLAELVGEIEQLKLDKMAAQRQAKTATDEAAAATAQVQALQNERASLYARLNSAQVLGADVCVCGFLCPQLCDFVRAFMS